MPGVPRDAGLRRVFVFEVDLVGLGHDFARIVMAAGTANMVRALQLASIRAFGGIAGDQRIMGAAHVPLGAGNSVLWDSHVTTSVSSGDGPLVEFWVLVRGFPGPLTPFRPRCPTPLARRPGT